MDLSPFLVVLLAAFASWWLLWLLIPRLRRGLLDQPNHRSSHSQPTPRGGGVVFVLVGCFFSVLALFFSDSSASTPSVLVTAPLLALPLALVGLLDDRLNLPASWRFGTQLATSLIAVWNCPFIFPSLGFIPLFALLVIAATAVINFTNFMDGLDGLVAGCMVVVITSAAIQLLAPLPVWALVGSLLGFLVWNWSPSKVFMGDVGSTFLGAVFSMLVLQSSSWNEALSMLVVAIPLLADALLCVPRRIYAGQRVFEAHRLHLYQRLHQSGWSHVHVTLLYVAATALVAIAQLVGGLPWAISIALLELLIGAWLDQHVAVPFLVASRN